MILGGILISSVEYPGNISLVIFTGGCILRCPYCHNPELINGGTQVDLAEIMLEIQDSLDFIDGLTITGGEPLIQHDELLELLEYVKGTDLKVKLDTNGCYPDRLKKIINYIDYVALDVKAPFNKYMEITGKDIGKDVEESMAIVMDSQDTFLECRTTYVPGLLDDSDIKEIARHIKCHAYTIQQFRNRVVLDDNLKKIINPTRQELYEIAEEIKELVPHLKIKTGEFGVEEIK